MTLENPYQEARDLVASIGGTMEWRPGGSPGGGAWEIVLYKRTKRIPCHDNLVNGIDNLYVPNVPNPQTWDNYDHPSRLKDDAFWLLVDLVRS